MPGKGSLGSAGGGPMPGGSCSPARPIPGGGGGRAEPGPPGMPIFGGAGTPQQQVQKLRLI